MVEFNSLTNYRHKDENEVFLKKFSEKVPLGRKAEVNEISGILVYLTSNELNYVTGKTLWLMAVGEHGNDNLLTTSF